MQPKPYRRIVRPFPKESSEDFPYDKEDYIRNQDYAPDRIEAVRSYFTLQGDLMRLFEYIEPADENLPVFSIRLYELLLRACTEIEASCKAILVANGYQSRNNLTMNDYQRIDGSSRLSDYEVELNIWRQSTRVVRPFSDWAQADSPSWYRAYNKVKHNRHAHFPHANLENAVSAIGGLLVVLFSQFYVHTFHTRRELGSYSYQYGFYSENDLVFDIKPPQTWTDAERYDFDWASLKNSSDPFELYSF